MSADDWYNNESFWREGYPFMFSSEAFDAAREQVDQIITLARVGGGRVLDLCCGPGRHAVPLALRGFEVTAVDGSPFLLLLSSAADHAARARVEVEFVRADMREFRRPASFDLAISMFSSFGYFDDEEDDLRVAANLHASLRPGGRVLIDVMSKELTARFRDALVSEAGGVTRVERHEIVDDWTRIRSEWILIRETGVQKFRYSVRLYSGRELRNLLHAAGFEDVRLYGDLTGSSYGPSASRLIALARKD